MTTSLTLELIAFAGALNHEGMERGSNAEGAALRAFKRHREMTSGKGPVYDRLESGVADLPIAKSPFEASAAISLKRIADNTEPVRPRQIALYVAGGGTHIFQQVNSSDSRNVYRGTFGEIILQDFPAT